MQAPESRISTLEKLVTLKQALGGPGRTAIALSGGVDSAFLAAVCADVPGLDVLAVTAISELSPSGDVAAAREVAERLGIRHAIVEFDPLFDPIIMENPVDRCFFCRERMLGLVLDTARAAGIATVLDGAIADDADEFRPGAAAARNLGVKSPLADAGMTKDDVRTLSRDVFGLPWWDRPASPCLATRFPHGTAITPQRVRMVREVEDALSPRLAGHVRARFFDGLVKLELEPRDMPAILDGDLAGIAIRAARNAGFHTVAVDLEPYRTGRMDEIARGTR